MFFGVDSVLLVRASPTSSGSRAPGWAEPTLSFSQAGIVSCLHSLTPTSPFQGQKFLKNKSVPLSTLL